MLNFSNTFPFFSFLAETIETATGTANDNDHGPRNDDLAWKTDETAIAEIKTEMIRESATAMTRTQIETGNAIEASRM